jgi:hypothetical protein
MKLVGLLTSMFKRRHFYEVLPMDPVAWPLLLAAHREALRTSMAERAVLNRVDPSTMQPPAAKASLSSRWAEVCWSVQYTFTGSICSSWGHNTQFDRSFLILHGHHFSISPMEAVLRLAYMGEKEGWDYKRTDCQGFWSCCTGAWRAGCPAEPPAGSVVRRYAFSGRIRLRHGCGPPVIPAQFCTAADGGFLWLPTYGSSSPFCHFLLESAQPLLCSVGHVCYNTRSNVPLYPFLSFSHSYFPVNLQHTSITIRSKITFQGTTVIVFLCSSICSVLHGRLHRCINSTSVRREARRARRTTKPC